MNLCPSFKGSKKFRISIAEDDTIQPGGQDGTVRQAWKTPREEGCICFGASTVTLVRNPPNAPLGIGIAGGLDTNSQPRVSFLSPGGIAHRSDGICVGDLLVSVNDIRVGTLKHQDILTLLRGAGERVCLQLEYSLMQIRNDKPAGVRSRTTDIVLEKDGESFGFILRGGSWGPGSENSRPLTVVVIRAGGPADRECRLQVGDRINAIGGVDVSSSTLSRAQLLIHEAKGPTAFTVEYDVANADLTVTRIPDQPCKIEIGKLPGTDFGVTLEIQERVEDRRKAVCVQKITPASPADRCGFLKVGDELLTIDGSSMEYTSLAEAYQLLRGSAKSSLQLEVLAKQPASNGNFIYQQNKTVGRHSSTSYRKPGRVPKRSESSDGGFRASTSRESSLDHLYQESKQRSRSRESRTAPNNGYVSDSGWSRVQVHAPSTANGGGRNAGMTSSVTASVSGLPCSQVCHSEVMEVALSCYSRGSYGIILHRAPNAAYGDHLSPLFVSYIERGSPADKSGVLQVGDRVLAINDWCTSSGSAEEANHQIRHSQGALSLTVEFDVIETVLPSSGVFTVKLAKRCQNLGIVISSTAPPGSSSAGQKGEPVLVSDVRTGSVAHRCGSIHGGDQILTIDNIPLDTCTVEEAARLLQRASDIVKLRVRKNAIGCPAEDIDNGPQTVVYSVELSRRGGPLGITIAGTEDKYDPIFISQLAPGGLAEKTGALHIGDRILAINNTSLADKRVSEAIQYLQQASDSVMLKIGRTVDPGLSSLMNGSAGRFDHNRMTGRMMPFSFNHPDHGSEQDSSDKLGTPVQSIDSAVESLEDSPESQIISCGSNRNSQNSKSSLSGHGGSIDNQKYVDDLNQHLHKSLSSLRAASQAETNSNSTGVASSDGDYSRLGGEACPCQSNMNQAHHDWMRVLEALETVGEAEMLRKLEESILSGTVPCESAPSCSAPTQSPLQQSGTHASSNPGPPPPPRSSNFTQAFPMTNTILKHPFGIGGSVRPPLMPSSNGLVGRQTTSSNSSDASGSRRESQLLTGSNSNISVTSSNNSGGGQGAAASSATSAHQLAGGSSSSPTSAHVPRSSGIDFERTLLGRLPSSNPQSSSHQILSDPSMLRSPDSPLFGRISSASPSRAPSNSSAPSTTSITTSSFKVVKSMSDSEKLSSALLATYPSRVLHDGGDNMSHSSTATAESLLTVQTSMPPSSFAPNHSSHLATNTTVSPYPDIPYITSPLLRQTHTESKRMSDGPISVGGGSTLALSAPAPSVPTELLRVLIHKDRVHNDFGFSVSDGVHEKGVYINKIRGGGPADAPGCVRPYDRILQVNATNVRDLDCMLTVPLLAAAGDTVELLVSRDPTMAVASRALYAHIEEDELSSPGSDIVRHTEV